MYGKIHNKNITEKTKLNPETYYAKSKIKSENILKKYFKSKLLILRIPGVFGFGDDFKSTIGSLIKQSESSKKILIKNYGLDKRDYLFVNDLSKIIILLIKKECFGIFNIVTGKSFSIKYIVNLIVRNSKNKLIYCKTKNQDLIKNSNLVYDNSLLKKLNLNYKFTSLKSSINNYILAYKKNEKS